MLRRYAEMAVVGVALLGAGGCQPHAAPGPAELSTQGASPNLHPTPAPVPEWWHEGPMRSRGRLSVCAMADDEELLGARRQALEEAMRVFREASGGNPGDLAVETDSIRLGGRFRAYVRVTGTEKQGNFGGSRE